MKKLLVMSVKWFLIVYNENMQLDDANVIDMFSIVLSYCSLHCEKLLVMTINWSFSMYC